MAYARMPRCLLAFIGARALHTGVAFNPSVATAGSRIKRARVEPLNANSVYEKSALGTAAAAAAAVSKGIADKDLSAPDLDKSFISLDSSASHARDVDANGLPLVYNKELIELYWRKERGALQARWAEFLRYSVPFLTRCAGLLIKGGSAELAKNDVSLAREAREIMEALGPTYVKLGQVLSVRPDILPPAALKELTILQDSVKKFPTSVALEVIEAELGGPVENFFVDMTPEPVAAASLAQVYRATIAPGHEGAGTEVAVKVQRPDVLELVSKDLYVLRRAAEVYQGLVDRFAPQQRTNWVALLNEWAVGFYTELDFLNELANQDEVKQLLAQEKVAGVYVPDTFRHLSSRKVLVTEWVHGVKLSQCEPSEIRSLISVGQEAFLVQLLQVGLFHADPHPGNLMRLDDSMRHKGDLALLDFGLVARLGQKDMDQIVSAIVHLANRDYPSLVDDFIELEILPTDCDRSLVVPLMDKALTPYVKGGGAEAYTAEIRKTYGFAAAGSTEDGTWSAAAGGFQAMTQDLVTVLNDVPFSIPPYFALIGRAVVTLEGVALGGDPSYGIITEAYPFVARKLLKEDRPEIQRTLVEVLYGGGGERKALSPRRLAALVKGALGTVGKSEGSNFIDLDAVGTSSSGDGDGNGDGDSPRELACLLLSSEGAVTSLWRVLEPELLGAVDLLTRQASRRAASTAWGQLPRPRLPFLGTLGPAPQDVRGPLLLPTSPTMLSAVGSAVSPTESEVASGGASPTGGVPRIAWVSSVELVDALFPPLNREDELYALSLVDACSDLLGPDVASLLRGEASLPLSPNDAAASLRALLDAAALTTGVTPENGAEDSSIAGADATPAALPVSAPALSSALAALAAFLPASPASHDGHASGGAAVQVREAARLYADLSPPEAQRAREITSRLAQGLIAKLESRLIAL